MNNILKKQNKIILISIITLVLFSVFSFGVKSQRSSKRNTSSRASVRSVTPTPIANTPIVEITETVETTSTQISKDTSHITKYNCEKLYMGCMNETCFNNMNGKCSCSSTTLNNKFNDANKNCEYIVDACKSKKNDIIESYKRMAKSDCTSYTIQEIKNENNNSSVTSSLANLTDCMRQRCVLNRTDQFLNCFDKDNLEKALGFCEYKIKDAKNPTEVVEMFNSSLITYKTKYCDDIMGTLKEDGECYLQIGFGKSYKSISKIKEFKVGDTVKCSENDFGVDLGGRERDKIIAIKNIALAGVSVVKTGIDITNSVLKGKREGVIKDEETTEASIPVLMDESSPAPKVPLMDESSPAPAPTTTPTNTNTVTRGTTSGDGAQVFNIYKGSGELVGGAGAAEILTYSLQGLTAAAGAATAAIDSAVLLSNSTDEDFAYEGYCFVIKGEQKKQLFGASDEYYYNLRWAPGWSEDVRMDIEGLLDE